MTAELSQEAWRGELAGLRFRADKIDCPYCDGKAGTPYLVGGNPDSLDHVTCKYCDDRGFWTTADVKRALSLDGES